MRLKRTLSAIAATVVALVPAGAQGAAATSPASEQQQGAALPPATKLEAFKPSAGSVLTMGLTDLGKVRGLISVQARELRDVRGLTARGLVVEVTQSQYRQERSFVDADEVPELVRGIDALLAVKANPTSFADFEVQYETHGALRVTAYSYRSGVEYAVRAGRNLFAENLGLSTDELLAFRGLIAKGQTTLAATAAK